MHRIRLIAGLLVVGTLAGCVTTNSGLVARRSEQGVNVPPPDSIPTGSEATTPGGPGVTVPLIVGDTTAPGGVTVPPELSADNTIPVTDNDVIDFGSRKRDRDYDGFLVAAVKDIVGFWREEFQAVYGDEFVDLEGGIKAAYRRRPEAIQGCGERTTSYDEVEGNAFYCSLGDFMVYDDDRLMPALSEELGNAAIGVVFAHEFGHAVQFRAGEIRRPTILKEQQADCFAGAWTAHITRGENDEFQFSDREVRAGLIAMIQVADPVETSGSGDLDAHGTGFDRVGAFQDGFVGGAERCKSFFTENRQLVDIRFDGTDENLGNLPLRDRTGGGDDFVTLIPGNLDLFWTRELLKRGITFRAPALTLFDPNATVPRCDGDDRDPVGNAILCASSNEVLADEDFATKLIGDIGDMSIGYIVAQAYSEAVQRAVNSPLAGEERALMNDCLTGVWAKSIIPGTGVGANTSGTGDTTPQNPAALTVLSAGDLDEAVITAIRRSDVSADTNVRGSAFEKIAAFRQGVLDGAAACSVLK